MDLVREQQLKQEWEKEQRKKRLESLPPGTANVLEYQRWRWWDTNGMSPMWWGVWVEDANTGWRVNLCPDKSNTVDRAVIVKVGSVITNSGAGLLPSPDGKYAKLELSDANGKTVPTKRGAAMNLYQMQYDVVKESQLINNHPPSGSDTTVERNYPDTITDLEYTRSNMEGSAWKIGRFFNFAGFASNGPPCQIGFIRFNDVFSIEKEGDYKLTVQPVLYRMHNESGTFQGYLDRVNLPSVTTKVHLVPNVK